MNAPRTEKSAMAELRIQNRDKRLADYQRDLHELRAENKRLREALQTLLSHYGDAREALFPHKTPHDTPAMQAARAALKGE